MVLLQQEAVDVCGPCDHQKPSGCLWSGLPTEAMLMSYLALQLDHCCRQEIWPCP